MANVKFLMGDLADLPNTKTEGQVYFTYKNVGSADNPNYVGALYLDKNNSVRIKMTANAGIAEKDSAGNTITSTYIKNISISGTTITVTRGDNKTFTLSTQDNKVTQSYVAAADYNYWRPIPWGASNSVTEGFTPSTVTDSLYTTTTLSFQPSTGTVRATKFKGALIGNADTATSAATLQTNAGSATQPVYFSGGKPIQCSGTLAYSISGNAATATRLQTARSINGTNFDGTGNITTTNWGTSRTLTIGGTSKSVNGGSNISWSLSEIGASAIGHTHNYAGSASAGGSANSAVKLDTATSGSATQPVYFSGGKPVACTYTLGKSVPSNAVFTDTNTWRPLGTTADTACAGNDSRLSNARPASDVYAWAKASTKPSYSWGEITGKPSTFTPSSHEHNKIIRSTHLNTIDALNAFKEANAFKYATVSALSGLIGLDQKDGIILSMTWKDSTAYGHQIFIDDSGYTIAHRYNGGNTWSSWSTILDSSNYTSYTVSKTGSGASGTWGINVTGSAATCSGNAATATKLKTARSLTVQDSTGAYRGASASFDGGTPIDLLMPSKGKFVDGLKLGDGSTSDATKNSIEFYTTSTTSAGAKIVAYSDRIEFVFA